MTDQQSDSDKNFSLSVLGQLFLATLVSVTPRDILIFSISIDTPVDLQLLL